MLNLPHLTLKIAAASAIAAALGAAASKPPNLIPYPEGFRGWLHVKSAINQPSHPQFGKFSGMYHIYANKQAAKGYRTGRFDDGSVLVFDLRKGETKDHVTQAVGRHFVDVMVKDSKRYKATGGWGYEEFQGNSREIRTVSTTKSEMRCHSCHATQEARGFVFSSIAD
jgi:hypothetical protein